MWSLCKEICEIVDDPFKEKAGTEEMGSLQVEVEHLVGKGESAEKVREGEEEGEGEGEEVGSPEELLAEEDFHEETGQLCYLMILC